MFYPVTHVFLKKINSNIVPLKHFNKMFLQSEYYHIPYWTDSHIFVILNLVFWSLPQGWQPVLYLVNTITCTSACAYDSDGIQFFFLPSLSPVQQLVQMIMMATSFSLMHLLVLLYVPLLTGTSLSSSIWGT